MIRARRLSRMQAEIHESCRREVENMAYLMGLIRVEIYRAKNLPMDIYVLKGVRNSSCVVLGGDVFEHLSQKEINALIYFSILKIKRLNLKFIQGCNFFFFIISLPTMVAKNFKLLKFIGVIMDFFLLPLKTFKKFVFKEDRRYLEELIEKLEVEGRESVIQATLFKLKHISSRHTEDVYKLLLADLAMVENYE